MKNLPFHSTVLCVIVFVVNAGAVLANASLFCDFEATTPRCQPTFTGSWGVARGSASHAHQSIPSVDHTFGNGSGHYIFLYRWPYSAYESVIFKHMLNITTPSCLDFWSYVYPESKRMQLKVLTGLGSVEPLYYTHFETTSIPSDGKWTKHIVNLPYGVYTIKIDASITQGTVALDDIKLVGCVNNTFVNPTVPPDIFPNCNFDAGLCGYSNENVGDVWIRSGGYMYVTADQTNAPYRNGDAHLITPKFTVPYGITPYCMQFYWKKQKNGYNWSKISLYNVSDPDLVNFVWRNDAGNTDDWRWQVVPLSPGEAKIVFPVWPIGHFAIKNVSFIACPAVKNVPILPEKYIRHMTCDFETSFCGIDTAHYFRDVKDNFKWAWTKNTSLPSNSVMGQNKTDNFMYVKNSGFTLQDDATMVDIPILISYPKLCLAFDYYMHGSGQDVLKISMYLDSFYTWAKAGDQGNQWHHEVIRISSSISPIQVPIKVTKKGVGMLEIGIDNIVVDECAVLDSKYTVKPTSTPTSSTKAYTDKTTVNHKNITTLAPPKPTTYHNTMFPVKTTIPNVRTQVTASWQNGVLLQKYSEALHHSQELEDKVDSLETTLTAVVVVLVLIILILGAVLLFCFFKMRQSGQPFANFELKSSK